VYYDRVQCNAYAIFRVDTASGHVHQLTNPCAAAGKS
jgi:hypothetical protein